MLCISQSSQNQLYLITSNIKLHLMHFAFHHPKAPPSIQANIHRCTVIERSFKWAKFVSGIYYTQIPIFKPVTPLHIFLRGHP